MSSHGLPGGSAGPPAGEAIVWLHLTDLHCGQPGERTRWPTARGPFLDDLRAQAALGGLGPPQMICISGDLAYSGKAREYDKVQQTLADIRAAVGGNPVVVAVPGNHDLTRPSPADATALGLARYHDDGALRRELLSRRSSTHAFVRRRFDGYQKFFRDVIEADWKARGLRYRLGALPGDFILHVPFAATAGPGGSLAIVGLNSAFLQLLGGDYERRLAVEPEQLPGDLPRELETADAALLLLHHPPDWLHRRCREAFERDIHPPGRFVACLFGHMHAHRALSETGAAGLPRRYLQGSSLFGLEQWGETETRETGYAWYRLTRSDAAAGVLQRFPRKALFRDDGSLSVVPDLSAGPSPQSYRVTLRARPTPPASPVDPPRPPVLDASAPGVVNPFLHTGRVTDPAQFVGRRALLHQILGELDGGSNRALIGPAQIGKSSILSMVCALGPSRLRLPPSSFVYLNLQLFSDAGDFWGALCAEAGLSPCRGAQLERALRGRRLILCLDEIEKLRGDRFPLDVREQLRGLADGADAPVRLLIASRTPLFHLFPDAEGHTSPLYNICPQLDVPPLSPAECRELLARRVGGGSMPFDDAQVAGLTAQSGGLPATLLSLASDLWTRLRAPE